MLTPFALPTCLAGSCLGRLHLHPAAPAPARRPRPTPAQRRPAWGPGRQQRLPRQPLAAVGRSQEQVSGEGGGMGGACVRACLCVTVHRAGRGLRGIARGRPSPLRSRTYGWMFLQACSAGGDTQLCWHGKETQTWMNARSWCMPWPWLCAAAVSCAAGGSGAAGGPTPSGHSWPTGGPGTAAPSERTGVCGTSYYIAPEIAQASDDQRGLNAASWLRQPGAGKRPHPPVGSGSGWVCWWWWDDADRNDPLPIPGAPLGRRLCMLAGSVGQACRCALAWS